MRRSALPRGAPGRGRPAPRRRGRLAPAAVLVGGGLLGGGLLVGAAGPSAVRPGGALHGPVLAPVAPFFRTGDRCVGCHSGVTSPAGEDVSIGYDWRASMMANSARDPYWQAAVRREVMDHPGEQEAIEDECSKCHMPMARATAASAGRPGRVFEHLAGEAAEPGETSLAMDGVSCSLCHQILADGLGQEASFSGGFRLDEETAPGERNVFGTFETDQGRLRVMHSATGFRPTEATHVQDSELCATCHTLTTHALVGAPGARLPEQMPYLEWRASGFAGQRSCQSCHMPEVEAEVAVTSVLGQPRAGVSRHVFRGGNFFMLRMLNRYRGELGVTALPQELEAAASRTVEHLRSQTARVQVSELGVAAGRLTAEVAVTNLAGHKFPTAYPSRRAWLHLTVRDGAGGVVFESGAFRADGSVAGNDMDEDATRFEPHHEVVERPDQVQVYESVMFDAAGRPTTGLLSAVRFGKDNRLLPDAFDRALAGADAAVLGDAARDADFTGGSDRVRYQVDVAGRSGPFTVEAELWYQPIAWRWARNLAGYDAVETRRFVDWYGAMAASSAVVVASDTRSGNGG